MSRWPRHLNALVLALAQALSLAAEAPARNAAKPEAPPLPVIRLVQPLGIEVARTTRLRLRGQHLDGTNQVHVRGIEAGIRIVAQTAATPVAGLPPERIGDRQIELELDLSRVSAVATNASVVVAGPGGESVPFPLLLVPPGSVTGEKEPNDGFRTAPGAPVPVRIRGNLESKGEVDVFRITLQPGRRFRAEILAARHHSTLDAMLTLYDSRLAVVASADDTLGRDPVIDHDVVDGGDYFIAVGYANDDAAPTHEYLLNLSQP